MPNVNSFFIVRDEELLNREEIKDIFSLDDISKVRDGLLEISRSYSMNEEETSYFMNKILILYVKTKKDKLNNEHFIEELLPKVCKWNYDEFLEYLLCQPFDCEYDVYTNCCSTPLQVIDLVGLDINTPKAMEIIINKLKELNRTVVYDYHTDNYRDLCRMYIIAGDLRNALEYFNSSNYSLLRGFESNEQIEFVSNYLQTKKSCAYIDGFTGISCDNLYQIIKVCIEKFTIFVPGKGRKFKPDLEMEFFLLDVIYSDKIKLLNTEVISLLKATLSENGFSRYIHYLEDRIQSGDLTLFSLKGTRYDNIIWYDTLENVLNPGSDNIQEGIDFDDVDIDEIEENMGKFREKATSNNKLVLKQDNSPKQ